MWPKGQDSEKPSTGLPINLSRNSPIPFSIVFHTIIHPLKLKLIQNYYSKRLDKKHLIKKGGYFLS